MNIYTSEHNVLLELGAYEDKHWAIHDQRRGTFSILVVFELKLHQRQALPLSLGQYMGC
jgi:hypothetical protein